MRCLRSSNGLWVDGMSWVCLLYWDWLARKGSDALRSSESSSHVSQFIIQINSLVSRNFRLRFLNILKVPRRQTYLNGQWSFSYRHLRLQPSMSATLKQVVVSDTYLNWETWILGAQSWCLFQSSDDTYCPETTCGSLGHWEGRELVPNWKRWFSFFAEGSLQFIEDGSLVQTFASSNA